jgi:hypothetical protein
MHLKRVSLFLVAMTGSLTLFSQFNTYSPYTRFGLGDLSKNGFAQNLAMGGTGLAIHENNRINYLNPAASASLDSTSVYFDFGGNVFFNQYQFRDQYNEGGANLTNNWWNMNFHHVAFGTSMGRHLGLIAGIVPYSSIGYSIKQEYNDYLTGTAMDTYFTGEGGIMNFFVGASVKMFDRVSVGVTMNYLMGKLTRNRKVLFPSHSETYSNTTSSENFDLRQPVFSVGLQYREVIADKFFFTLGGAYDFSTNTSVSVKYQVQNSIYALKPVDLNDSVTIEPVYPLSSDTTDRDFVMPQKTGLGIAFGIPNKLILTADYYMKDWSGALEGINYRTAPSSSLHVGAEFTPDRKALRGYLNFVSFRLGGYYANTYMSVKKPAGIQAGISDFYQLKDYGITFGVGLPIRSLKSSFNVAFTLGTRGTTEYNLVKENYGIITFNVTLHDLWFRKRRFD